MIRLLIVLFIAVGSGSLAAQAVTAPAAPAPAAPALPATPSTDYIVGPGDVLSVTVRGENTGGANIRVDSDGTIPLQPFFDRVKVEGMTPAQIEAKLKKDLGDSYIRNPQVSIEITDFRSQSVFVTGEVRSPNKYYVKGNNMTLMDVLTEAGSVTGDAGNWVQITHQRQGMQPVGPSVSPEYDLRVNLRDIQTGKAQNITLRDGDTIYVPRAEKVYVTGEVRNTMPLTFEEGMTVHEVVSLAGGPNEKGRNAFQIRRLIKGQLRTINARPTDLVQAGDQVVVLRRRL
jgi:polysaccharide export outer membrane protein